MNVVREIVERLRFAAAALVVSTFPERVKRTGLPAVYSSVAAHIVSGWAETLISAALFVLGLLDFGERFTQSAGWTYVSHRPSLTYGDFMGVGLVGYLSYLLTPRAWVTVFCFGEGIVRALDAAISARLLGTALVVVPWGVAGAARRAAARVSLLARLGPERPDEVVPGETGSPVPLVVFASREKPWAANQVIEYRDEFLTVSGRRLVERGDHAAYRYDFRRLEPGEVIRGVLLRYDPEGTAAPPSRAGSVGGSAAG